jgi:DNA-directed RNA polymerase alpha subunit
MNKSIAALNLGNRAHNALLRGGIDTIAALKEAVSGKRGFDRLLDIRNLGVQSRDEIEAALKKFEAKSNVH